MSSQQPARSHLVPDRVVRHRRDLALERTRSVTKTIAVASVAAVAAFGIYISRALPGHSTTTSGSAGSTASPPVGSTSGGGTSGGQASGSLAPPSSPPVQTQQQAPVVSGSS